MDPLMGHDPRGRRFLRGGCHADRIRETEFQRRLDGLCARPGRAVGPAAGRPPAPPGRLRRHLGRDPARPEGRPRGVDRPAAEGQVPIRGVPADFAAFADRLADRRWPRPSPIA